MKVKLFTAPSMNEAMTQVKQDLGRDAVILHTRRFRKGGFWGFFGKDMIEVMAALEAQPTQVKEKKILQTLATIPVPPVSSFDETKVVAMQNEITDMRKMLEKVLVQLPQASAVGVTEHMSPLFAKLIQNDVETAIAANLVRGLPAEHELAATNPEVMHQLLFERLNNYLQKIDGITIPAVGCKTVALIGPTGVGKTTTIAKLAANFAIKEGRRVAMITADTYRIAAVEQLKTYSDIIGVPIEIVYSPEELKEALQRHRDKQLVLIDTAGRSPGNPQQLAELQSLLAVDPYIETHLVLSVTTKYRDALETVNKFAACAPQKFLFTKIDEAVNLGTILNLLYHFPTALSYVTTGQNVPDDIELAQPAKLANLILRN